MPADPDTKGIPLLRLQELNLTNKRYRRIIRRNLTPDIRFEPVPTGAFLTERFLDSGACHLARSQIAFEDQLLFIPKVVVERTLCDTQGIGDSLQRGIRKALGVQNSSSGIEDFIRPILTV